jgi:hypothetical protein
MAERIGDRALEPPAGSPDTTVIASRRLGHLERLEAESIHIMREVAAEFTTPVMLYSIGKDSSVMLHLAMKAFYPGKPPFPLLHVDTTWKFREMIRFRDATAERLGLELFVHINEDGVKRGINPFDSGSNTVSTRPSAGLGATKRKAAPRSASSRSARPITRGTRRTSAPNCGSSTIRAYAKENRSASSRSRIGRSLMSGNTSWQKTFLLYRSISPRTDRW